MRMIAEAELQAMHGGGWLAEWGGGFACGLAIGAAVTSGGIAVPVAIATCAWALG
jgi:hypothetical protein